MRVSALTVAVPLFTLLSLAAPAPARAQSCFMSASGDLPIGQPGDPGHWWKQTIVAWLAGNDASDFRWVEPVEMVDPVQAYGAGTSLTGNLCALEPQVAPPPWSGLGPAERLHIEQYWLMMTAFYVPYSWMNHDPDIYTLAEMTDLQSCRVRTPGLAWGDSLAFFAGWEYAGSPFRPGTDNNTALKMRLAAWLGLQLVMLDYAHWGATGSFGGVPAFFGHYAHPAPGASTWNDMNNGAELGGQLALLAWTFGHVRDVLDVDTEKAMRTALVTYAERVHLWNPYFPQMNRGIRATYGLRYVWEATGSLDAETWYQDALDQFFSPARGNWIAGGYWRDDYGFDMGYGGACMLAAVRVLSEDPSAPNFVRDAVERSQDLIAHLALPDLGGRWVAPNAFNSRTSMGSIRGVAPHVREGYYGGLERYLLGHDAGLPFAAATLRDVEVLGPQGAGALDPRGPQFHEDLACLGAGYNQYVNLALQASPAEGQTDARGQSDWPNLTRSQDWGPPPTFIENHHLGLLVDLWDHLQVAPEDALMPVETAGTAIRSFGGRFVYGRFGAEGGGHEFAAMLHLGEVGELPGGGESGFGGGQLAYFWTEEGGPTLLGRRKGRNTGLAGSDEDWNEWRSFPLHAVFLRTAAGKVTSSARIVAPDAHVLPLAQAPAPAAVSALLAGSPPLPATVPESQASAVFAWVKGQIPAMGHAEASGATTPTLVQPIDYRRSFLLAEDGLWVDTSLGARDPGDDIVEAWETLPIWSRDVAVQPGVADPIVTLYSATLGPVDGSTGTPEPVEQVVMVEILRGAGGTRITFDQPRWTRVSELWQLGDRQGRTLLVDRLPLAVANTATITATSNSFQYFIEEL